MSKLTDDEYKKAIEQSALGQRQVLSKFVSNAELVKVDKSTETLAFKTTCHHYGAPKRFTNIDITKPYEFYRMSCTDCKKRFTINPSSVFKTHTYQGVTSKLLDIFFESILNENKTVAIWGTGEKATMILALSKNARKCVVKVVDEDYDINRGRYVKQYIQNALDYSIYTVLWSELGLQKEAYRDF